MSLYNAANTLLPAFCKPYPDELFSSWMTRMAFDHGLTTRDFCGLIWEKYTNLDIDYRVSDENISLLAQRTACTFEQVKASTLRSYENNLFTCITDYSIDHWAIGPTAIKQIRRYSSGLMYCPKCLARTPYFKKRWRLAISFVCTTCGSYLIDRCPHCAKGSSFMFRNAAAYTAPTLATYLYTCHVCGEDVTRCTSEKADDAIVKAQQKLYDIIDHGWHGRVIYIESYFAVLHHIAKLLVITKADKPNLKAFKNDVYGLNNNPVLVEEKEIIPGRRIRLLPVKKRAALVAMASWLLDEWPHRLVALCSKHDINYRQLLKSFKDAPFWFCSTLMEALPCCPDKANEDSLSVLEEELLNYLAEKKGKLPDVGSYYITPVRKGKTLDYDYDLREYYYDENVYTDIDLENYVL